MAENLRLRKIADLVDGVTGYEQPAWYEVDGLQNGQITLIESTGNPQSRWRIKKIPSVDQSNLLTFETPEEALEALQQEVG